MAHSRHKDKTPFILNLILIEVSGQIHALAAFYQGEKP
jgi:hypothetical protein